MLDWKSAFEEVKQFSVVKLMHYLLDRMEWKVDPPESRHGIELPADFVVWAYEQGDAELKNKIAEATLAALRYELHSNRAPRVLEGLLYLLERAKLDNCQAEIENIAKNFSDQALHRQALSAAYETGLNRSSGIIREILEEDIKKGKFVYLAFLSLAINEGEAMRFAPKMMETIIGQPEILHSQISFRVMLVALGMRCGCALLVATVRAIKNGEGLHCEFLERAIEGDIELMQIYEVASKT